MKKEHARVSSDSRRRSLASLAVAILTSAMAPGAFAFTLLSMRIRARSAAEWFGNTPLAELAQAAGRGDITSIDRLLKAGVSVDGLSVVNRITPLMYALGLRNHAGAKRLLESGANPNAPIEVDGEPTYVIEFLAMDGEAELIELIIRFGANPNVVVSGRTPLIRSVRHLPTLRALIKGGADVNWDDGFRNTAASMAASGYFYDALKTLLEAGATAELDRVALFLQMSNYHAGREAQRRELILMLKARGAKIYRTPEHPDTPGATDGEHTPEIAARSRAEAAERRRLRAAQ